MEVGKEDAFERVYTQKFRELASKFGEFVAYERDRGARDIGLHFTRPTKSGREIVSSTLVWFQLKGLHSETLSKDKLRKTDRISMSLKVHQLQFWYLQPTPTYLVVYLQCVDKFFILDIRKYIEKTVGDAILQELASSKTISFSAREHELDENTFNLVLMAGDVELWKQFFSESDARTIVRDMHVVKSVGTAQKRQKEQRLTYKPWITKTRTEVIFEERSPGHPWEKHHEHWEYMMGELESNFPYLELTAYEDDLLFAEDSDGHSTEHRLILQSGEEIHGVTSGEYDIFELTPSLNELGKLWLERIETLEAAGIIEVNLDDHHMVCILPGKRYL